MTASRNIYTPRQNDARDTRLALRFSTEEMAELEELAKRYSRVHGLKRTTRSVLVRKGIEELFRAYPKETALVIRLPRLFSPVRHAA